MTDDKPPSQERFLYLGFQPKAHFFLHVVYAERTLELLVGACRGIFEAMLQAKMLEIDDSIVVFNISAVWKGAVVPIAIHHAGHARGAQATFDRDGLAETFMKLLDRPKNVSQRVASVAMCAGKPQRFTFYDYPSFAHCALISTTKAPEFEEPIYGFSLELPA
jgi:hypothetical protein